MNCIKVWSDRKLRNLLNLGQLRISFISGKLWGVKDTELQVKLVTFLTTCRILSGEGNGNPLQYSCLENPIDGGGWQAAVHGVAKSQTRLSNFTFTFHFHALEKEMATHSSVLAWRIPGTGGLVGCRLWGRTESDMTEVTQQQPLFLDQALLDCSEHEE